MSKDDVMLNKLLAKFILLNDVDVDIVRRPSFIDLLKGVAKHGSHYKLPCCSVVKENLVPDLEKEIGEYVAKVKKSWDTNGCTIISDIWCDKERFFITIFAHSIEGMVLVNALDIREGEFSSTLLREFISFVTEKIGANNIVQYITNEEGLYDDMPNYGHVYKTKCFAHELHSLFNKIHDEIEWVKKVFDQARAILTKICKHDGILSPIKQFTNNWELKQSSTIKLNFYSNYYMLQSIMRAESELQPLVSSSEQLSLGFEKDESGVDVGGINCNSEFWSEGKEVLHVLKSIFRVLRLVESYSATSGYLYAAVKMEGEAIKKICETNECKYQDLWDIFKQWQDRVIHPIHAAAAFLNPAYMCSEKFKINHLMREGMDFISEKLVGREERKNFLEEMNHYRNKGPKLFTPTAKEMLQTSHPCDWWEYRGDDFPVLQKYAIRILSQPCSTSSRRRSLSAFEIAQIEKRKPPVPAVMDNYLFLRTNALLMENFNAMNEKIGNPLDLEKLDELPDCTEFINGNFTSDLLNETKVPLSDGKLNCWSASVRKDGEREKHLLLHFITKLPPSLDKASEVKGERGAPIHVILVDSNTGSVVRSGPSSVLKLTVTVIKATLMKKLIKIGMGTLGNITFNDVSSCGTFRLGVKTELGCCEGIRVLEGTSNAFTVEDVGMADPNALEGIERLPCRETDNALECVGVVLSRTLSSELLGRSLAEPLTLSLGSHCQIGNASPVGNWSHVHGSASSRLNELQFTEDFSCSEDLHLWDYSL
ncbi:hypothetical protein NL676_008703 [Syzygium grande]|nr:hypothetical protein NL676_008703 [Syzygium grande]